METVLRSFDFKGVNTSLIITLILGRYNGKVPTSQGLFNNQNGQTSDKLFFISRDKDDLNRLQPSAMGNKYQPIFQSRLLVTVLDIQMLGWHNLQEYWQLMLFKRKLLENYLLPYLATG
jgi:hypothetical protein